MCVCEAQAKAPWRAIANNSLGSVVQDRRARIAQIKGTDSLGDIIKHPYVQGCATCFKSR